MDAVRVFFWYCKYYGIMDIMFKMYHEKSLGVWKYENGKTYYQNLSLRDYITQRVKNFGFRDLFWELQPRDSELAENEKYKKARSKWNAFIRNNILYSEDFVKVGDTFEGTMYGRERKGTIISINNELHNMETVTIRVVDEGRTYNVAERLEMYNNIKINGESRKPKYYIKRRRKLYGVN